MTNNVRHRKRQFKQMALEVAVRNPERYEGILKSFAKHERITLDDNGILEVYSQLYLDDVVTAEKLKDKVLTKNFYIIGLLIIVHITMNGDIQQVIKQHLQDILRHYLNLDSFMLSIIRFLNSLLLLRLW